MLVHKFSPEKNLVRKIFSVQLCTGNKKFCTVTSRCCRCPTQILRPLSYCNMGSTILNLVSELSFGSSNIVFDFVQILVRFRHWKIKPCCCSQMKILRPLCYCNCPPVTIAKWSQNLRWTSAITRSDCEEPIVHSTVMYWWWKHGPRRNFPD